MNEINSHKDLLVYQKSLDFVQNIYQLTAKFPEEEKFGLTSQMRKAAISIPSNIAEGAARQFVKEYIQFLYVSLGSIVEIETQLEIAKRLNFCIENSRLQEEIIHIKRMLIKLIQILKTK